MIHWWLFSWMIFSASTLTQAAETNLLLILDNSRSMVRDERLASLKAAVKIFLQESHGINAGLMSFNNPGAAVNFPVSDLDAPVPETWRHDTYAHARSHNAITSHGFIIPSTEFFPAQQMRTFYHARFENIALPQGADIRSARLITAATEHTLPVEVSLENTADSTPLYLSSTPEKPASVLHKASSWGAATDISYLLSDYMQQHANWCAFNALNFYIMPLNAEDYDIFNQSLTKSRFLKLETDYAMPANQPASCQQDLFTVRSQAFENSFSKETKFIFPKIPLNPGSNIIKASLSIPLKLDKQAQSLPELHFSNTISNPISNTKLEKRWLSAHAENKLHLEHDVTDLIKAQLQAQDWRAGKHLTLTASTGSTQVSTQAYLTILSQANDFDPKVTYTVKDELLHTIDQLSPNMRASLTDSLLEAALYFTGSPAYYGKSASLFTDFAPDLKARFNRVSHPRAVLQDFVYRSPIQSDQDTNHIVLITDSTPNLNFGKSIIASLTQNPGCYRDSLISGEQCARSLAAWMNETHNVQLHTIAFHLEHPQTLTFLQDIAQAGKGSFHKAASGEALMQVLRVLIKN